MEKQKKKLRAVLVGCGGISRAWMGPISKRTDVEVVGLVDLLPENMEKLGSEFQLGNAAKFSRLKEALDKLKPDLVLDCTIPAAHHEVTIEAARFGCHVLGEKPMAESMQQAFEMREAMARAGKTYAVIQNRRYQKEIITFKETLRAGEMGAITTLNADFYMGCHFGGFRDTMEHVLLLDMAIHTFDQARFICGKNPLAVYCHEWNPKGSWYRHGASANAIFEMSDGVVFNYRGSWCAEGIETSWECEWRASCERGNLLWDGARELRGRRVVDGAEPKFTLDKQPVAWVRTNDLEHEGHAGVIDEFINAIHHGTRPQTHCEDNINSLAMVHAATESAKTGRRVEIKI